MNITMTLPAITRRLAACAGVLLALSAAGCATPGSEREAAKATVNPIERFPMTAHATADETLLAVHAEGISPTQQSALADLAARWRDSGGQLITLRAPQQGGGAAYTMAERTRAFLIGQGVSPQAVRIEGYDTAGDAKAPMVVAFSRYEADVPKCGQRWDNLSATKSNDNFGNFGCATSANMAAQVANPADLVAAQPMSPSDAGRRSVVMDAYRRGVVTGAQLDSTQTGVVSQVIK